MLRAMLRCLLLVIAIGCSSPAPKTSVIVHDDVPERFEDLAFFVAGHLHRNDPADAVSLGHHKFDGVLPDRTPAAIADDIKRLERDRDALLAYASGSLTPLQQDERDVLLAEVRGRLFQLVDLDAFRTNPMSYTPAINLDAYIIRDYAPPVVRAAAVIKLCTGLPTYLAQARTNLMRPMPRPWIDTALFQTTGLATFVEKDVRHAFTGIMTPLANQAEIGPALDTCKMALTEHARWLTEQQARGTTAFALGTERFLKMLAETQGVVIELPRLTAIANEDLRRNLAAMEEAARAIDPKRSVADVVRAVAEERPAPADVLDVATQQTAAMRRFVLDHRIATIPGDDVALVRESPPFARWNAASLNRPGPFETAELPSYYYISPPDPSWPAAEQRAYIPPRTDLLFVTIHEVYPGHFLQGLHIQRNPSRVLQSFCTYSNSEGWAHYTEEMMFDAGVEQTPRARIGMLKEALLRNVRFVATIGLHTGGMTVEQATALFANQGFVDAGNARQQAVRGTFDPMYLSYTLGKLMIRRLATDWLAANPGKTLGQFHDAFLSHGCAPIPVIRRALLGASLGAPL
jgi:hypothetical protein